MHRTLTTNKKALSPLVATVLLVALSVTIAAIIYIWLQSFITEQTLKNDALLDKSCEQVGYTSEVSSSSTGDMFLTINNVGNIPIYQIYIKSIRADGSSVVWPKSPMTNSATRTPVIGPGAIIDLTINDIRDSGAVKIQIIPALYGTGKKSGKPKIGFCPTQMQEKDIPQAGI